MPLIFFSSPIGGAHELGKSSAPAALGFPTNPSPLDSLIPPFDDPITRVPPSPETPSLTLPAKTHRRPLRHYATALLIFAIALGLDVPVSTWVHDIGLSAYIKDSQGFRYYFIHYGLRFYGLFWFTILACIVLIARKRTEASLIVLVSGIFSSVNQLVKWAVGRYRPFHGEPVFAIHPFIGGLAGLRHAEVSLGFPSGDATLAFAMTASLGWAAPKQRFLWWALGIWICLERIAEGAHYPSDTVAGACLGLFVAHVARRLVTLLAPPPMRATAP
jgi:membrane-associated phospholipid phosphatase